MNAADRKHLKEVLTEALHRAAVEFCDSVQFEVQARMNERNVTLEVVQRDKTTFIIKAKPRDWIPVYYLVRVTEMQ